MNNIFVRAMKCSILACVLILLVQKNSLSYAKTDEFDYDDLFATTKAYVDGSDDQDIYDIFTHPVTHLPRTSAPKRTTIPVLKKTTTLRPSEKKVPPSLVRVSTNKRWEDPEVTISIFLKQNMILKISPVLRTARKMCPLLPVQPRESNQR